jgi:hypothetical protein
LQAYLLTRFKIGWMSLPTSPSKGDDFMRLDRANSEVEVARGSLVEIDPLCDFDSRANTTLNVVGIDRPEVKCTVAVNVSLENKKT